MADSDTSEFEGSLFPVFVTADLPLETINDILKRSVDYTAAEELDALEGLVLVTTVEGFDVVEPTRPPVTSFSSPVLGRSVEEVARIFEENIAPGDEEEETPKASSVFAVLDERTGRDRTVLLVSLEAPEAGDAGPFKIVQVRAEPEIAAISSMGPEMGTMGLGEGADDARGADGVIVLTEERYRRVMDEEMDDEDDYDEEELEGMDDDDE